VLQQVTVPVGGKDLLGIWPGPSFR
jgi:hypothetical protein